MFRMSEQYLKATLVIHWNLKGLSVVAVTEIVRWEIERGNLSPSPASQQFTIR